MEIRDTNCFRKGLVSSGDAPSYWDSVVTIANSGRIEQHLLKSLNFLKSLTVRTLP